jgi:thiol-disulfide isomerase/thioredoxin
MVDWDRVDELRSKGWGWDRIADDEDVGFHPDASVQDPGRALRSLYHRQRNRADRREVEERPKRQEKGAEERRWTMVRIGFLIAPILGLWALLAYLVPSPIGILVPAIPYLALAFAVGAFILAFGLLRTPGRRWTPVLRNTLIGGVVVGLVFSGMIGLTGYLAFGCPFLPPQSSLGSAPSGWSYGPQITPWQDGGKPVFYFFGATWCPYCSASSWAMWKALTEFQTNFNGTVYGVPGTTFQYSNPNDVYPQTPEVVLGFVTPTSSLLSWQVNEYYWTNDGTGTAGTFPGTSNCFQQAFVSAYSGGSIPFVVVNGQWIHGGSTLIDPNDLTTWAGSGVNTVSNSVLTETGSPWSIIQGQAALICAFVLKANGYASVAAFLSANPGLQNPGKYQWTSGFQSLVQDQM